MASVYRESEHVGEVVWLGMAPARQGLRSGAQDALELGFHGLDGARHEGATRPACVRVKELYPKGTEIRNVRQLTILSEEELAGIAADIGLEALDPGLLGASVVVKGIPDFTHVPPSSRLQGPSGVALTVDMENLPCNLPAREIEADEPGHGKAFKRAAAGRRGVTAWVERPGTLRRGDHLTLWLPAQRAWAP
ncbi:MOSC domain-containing protein [Marinibacterium profundimaris]|uniref:Sulfurase n=1 Tax=Marinibacterium profundimaris TaxID=1679460 RepID=A0A225NHH1_9RHOB|nr:MOSC domain-containing protein [Marinibacterium profundimaris]OWU70413.1 sulfurase [Marinibacterium profundimaris]